MRKRHKLQNTVLFSFTILAIVLIIVISFVVGDRYIRGEMENCRVTAYSYTKSAAELIDGDKIAYYLETEEKDEYYYEILDVLNAFQSKADIQYFYVYVPFEDDLVYIWDADSAGEGACELGYREEYMDGGEEVAFSVFKKDPPEEMDIFNDETYGYIATAYSPIFDSNGDPVAIVGVDVFMPNLQANMSEFLVVVIVAMEAFLVIATQPTDSPYVVLGHPPKRAPAKEPTPSPRSVRWRPGSSRRSLFIMEERFLWSAMCSANTTNATGTYATAMVAR